jgi:hypothetical protein
MGSAGASGAAAEKMGKGRLAACERTMARSPVGACELDHASTRRAHRKFVRRPWPGRPRRRPMRNDNGFEVRAD